MKKRLVYLFLILYVFPSDIVFAEHFASCGNISGVPAAVPAVIKTSVDIIKILIPILLVLYAGIDIFKTVINKDPDLDRLRRKVVPKFIAAAAVFFVVFGAQLLFKMLEQNSMIECINCFINDNDICNYYDKELKKDNTKEFENAKKEREEREKKREKAREANEKKNDDIIKKLLEEEQKRLGGTKLDIANSKNLVGIFYTTWHHPNQSKVRIISQQSSFCEGGAEYYWGKPALGFYNSNDKNVIRTHMKQLAAAGVDFIIIDYTNMNPNAGFAHHSSGWNAHVDSPLKAILETVYEMRSEGEKTPYVMNWVWTGNSGGNNQFEGWQSVNAIYDDFYKNSKYENIWVYWNSKPFFLTTSPPTRNPERDITVRSMWGLNGVSRYDWTYLEVDNDKPARDKNGAVEQIGVSVAMQRSYMSSSDAVCRRNGETFYNQWKTAFKYHPKVVTVTWWNEWTALCLYGGTFTDEYTQECSRDIEPMSGGHGSKYYEMLKKYIAAYKGNQSCPHLTER